LGELAAGDGAAARASGIAGAAGIGGRLVEASNCRGVRMSTDIRSSSCGRFGSFGNGIKARIAANSAWRMTEVETPQGDASS
jgi:hypothetical protein